MKFLIKLISFAITIVVIVFLATQIIFRGGTAVESYWSEDDFVTVVEKLQLESEVISDYNLTNFVVGNISVEDTVGIDGYFTSEEISAFIVKANESYGPVSNVAVSLSGERKEASFTLTTAAVDAIKDVGVVRQYIQKAPEEVVDYVVKTISGKLIYTKGDIALKQSGEIDIVIDDLRIGMITVPQNIKEEVQRELAIMVNSIITPENGFSIEELRFEDGQLYYRGTVPSKLEALDN